jgi:hypothetical protein
MQPKDKNISINNLYCTFLNNTLDSYTILNLVTYYTSSLRSTYPY